jgi:uncharacterized protein HemY
LLALFSGLIWAAKTTNNVYISAAIQSSKMAIKGFLLIGAIYTNLLFYLESFLAALRTPVAGFYHVTVMKDGLKALHEQLIKA